MKCRGDAIAISVTATAHLAHRAQFSSHAREIFHLTCCARRSRCLLNRSRRKKYDKQKQGRTGVKIKRGSHLDASPARQCPRCDKGLHRRCERLAHCTARQRSPAGVSKRKEGTNSTRASRRRARICDFLTARFPLLLSFRTAPFHRQTW